MESQHFSAQDQILDVGAGAGKYSLLLRSAFPYIDALEIWPKNVLEYDLFSKYHAVYIGDIRTYDTAPYRLLIMGDLLEHLTTEEAQAVLANTKAAVLVVVPYMYPQEALSGNPAEEHKQPDLTAAVMRERYPSLVPLITDNKLGVYFQDGK